MTDIETLIKALKDAGIDTTGMTEEQIRELAKTITGVLDADYANNLEHLKEHAKNVDDTLNDRRMNNIQNNPAIVGTNPSRPQAPDLERKLNNQLNKGGNAANTTPSNNRPNVNPNLPIGNARRGNPPINNAALPNNNTKGTPGKNAMPGEEPEDWGKLSPEEKEAFAAENKAYQDFENAFNKEKAKVPSPEDYLNSPDIINKYGDSMKDSLDPKKNPDSLKKGEKPNGKVSSPGNRPVEGDVKPKSPENAKEKDNNGNPNSQNKKPSNPEDLNNIANNKIDRARRRLKQNGVDPDNNGRRNRNTPPLANTMRTSETDANLSGNTGEQGAPTSSGGGGLARKPTFLDRLRNRFKGNLNRNTEADEDYNDPKDLQGGIKDKHKRKLKNKLKKWVVSHLPQLLLAGAIFLLVFFLVLIIVVVFISAVPDFIDGDESTDVKEVAAGSETTCTYNAYSNNGTTDISNIKVELINCDGKSFNYRTLETIDFDKYVLGVALAEIGPYSPDEGIKAQMVAARTFALSRNEGMCPSDPDNCFYGYNKKTNIIRMRACEADQVYWDYEKDIYRQDRGAISLYSPEINSGTIWKQALAPDRKQQVLALADEVKGEVLVDSSGKPIIAGYKSTDQVNMLTEAKAGKNYREILEKKYGVAPSGGVCQTGDMDYNDYQLTSDNAKILTEPLSDFLSSKGTSIEEFNSLIRNNVQKAGSGTRAGVVSAAVTLLGELANRYSVRLPYFWGGGHEGMSELANGKWGSTSCYTTAFNNVYNHCGLDCSGFVGWAIYNGGFRDVTTVADSYVNVGGARHVNLGSSNALQPGDLLYNSGHVILIIGVDRNKNEYMCAEASGLESGVLFSRHSFDGDGGRYSGVDMSGFYDNSANKRG